MQNVTVNAVERADTQTCQKHSTRNRKFKIWSEKVKDPLNVELQEQLGLDKHGNVTNLLNPTLHIRSAGIRSNDLT